MNDYLAMRKTVI